MTTNVLTLAKNPAIGDEKQVIDLLKDFDKILQRQNEEENKKVIQLVENLAAEGFDDPSLFITPAEPAKVNLKSKLNGMFVTVVANEKGADALKESGMFVINPAVRTCGAQGYSRNL